MDFWRFLASSYEGAYLGVRNRVRFCQKLKKARIASQILLRPNKLISIVCLSFARLLLLPTGTQYPAGSPFIFGVLGRFLRRRVRGALCTFEIALSGTITLTLLFVCAFSPRVHSIPRVPRIFARKDIKYFVRHKNEKFFSGKKDFVREKYWNKPFHCVIITLSFNNVGGNYGRFWLQSRFRKYDGLY